MAIKLSILICSLEKRQHLLNRLLKVLSPQLHNEVEMLINTDKGEKTIGKKRNELLDSAQGEFITFIDDDDLISTDYVSYVLQGINQNVDIVGMTGIITINGRYPRKFVHSIKYDHWYEENNIFYRCPNHLNPVKKEFALQVRFPEINLYEDRSYSDRLYPIIKDKKEFFIDDPIYFYDYRSVK